MSHSLVKIWIHAVFGTKDRQPLINQKFENQLHLHIKNILQNDFNLKGLNSPLLAAQNYYIKKRQKAAIYINRIMFQFYCIIMYALPNTEE